MIWPASRGIGSHHRRQMDQARDIGIRLGVLNESNPVMSPPTSYCAVILSDALG